MALSSLTVDLNLSLSTFIADSGKAVQVVTADSAKMSKAAAAFTRSLQQQADQANRSAVEFQALRAAELGATDAAQKLIDIIEQSGPATATASAESVSAITSVAAAATDAAQRQKAINVDLVRSILAVNAAYSAQREALVAQQKSGAITPTQLKAGLAGLGATRNDDVAQLKAQAAAQLAVAAAETKSATSAQAFIAGLQRQVDAAGKSRVELLALEAAQHGVSTEAAPLLAALGAAERDVAGAGALSVQQLQSLEHSARAAFDAISAGANPIRVLATESAKLTGAFGTGGNALSGVLSLLTPVRVAMGLTAAAAAALGYAFVEGAAQSKAFKDSLVLTGNFAGVTEGQFNATAKAIAASGQISISAAREFEQALVSTGQIGPQGFDKATEAAARFGAATGKSATDVATQFASLTHDVTGGATQMNQSLNFLTAAQLQQIKTLQEQGKQTDALSIVYDALNQRLNGLEPNLGTLDKVIRGVTNTWHSFWDAAFDIGRDQTIEQKIDAARAAAAAARNLGVGQERVSQTQLDPERRAQLAAAAGTGTSQADNADEDVRILNRSQAAQQAAAAAQAATVALDKKAEDADAFVDGYERRAKSAAGLARDIAEANRQFSIQDQKAAQDPNYVASSAATRASILKKIRDEYTDKPAVTEGDAQRKALLDQDLKYLQDNLAKEQDALKYNNDVLSQVYSAGNISLEQYYDGKAAITAAGVQKELNELSDEQSRISVELDQGNFKDPHERIQLQTQLNESIAKSANLQRDADHAATLALFDRIAATKALTDKVNEFKASLLELQGDQTGAAKLRAAAAAASDKVFATQSGGGVDQKALDDKARATAAQIAYNDAVSTGDLISKDAERAQSLLALQQVQNSTGLLASEEEVRAARVKELEQITALRDEYLALAEANPTKYAEAAADYAIQVAKAAAAVDPALVRLRDSVTSTSQSIAGDIGNAIVSFQGLRSVVNAVEQGLLKLGTKILVTDPLEASIKGLLTNITQGDNPFAKAVQSALNISPTSASASSTALSIAQSAQQVAVTATTSALARLTLAANSAAASLGGSVGDLDLSGFSAADVDAALDSTAGATATAAGSSGGGFLSTVGSFIANLFHSGGIAGSNFQPRAVPASVFAGAMRYHGGGIAGLAPDEIAAVLKKGEEVLPTNSPRHRDNAGSSGATQRPQMVVQQTININHTGSMDKRSPSQIAAEAYAATSRAARRFG